MTFRVVRTNQYNQDLGLIHSTNGNHLESPNEGSSIDHQVTIHLHAQNITMFSTNETWGQSSHPTAKRPFQGPSKGPTQQGHQQYRPQSQQRPQQQGASAPKPGGYQTCKECNKQHPGPCMIGSGKFFHCKEPGHISRDFSKKRHATGRVFVMQAEATDPDTTLLTGEIRVLGVTTLALLDSGATHSFISSAFTQRMGITPKSLGIVTPRDRDS
ncbi:hypothetical protein F511_16977 [Dorcoceras hygrometricum]|uniref:Uncharacterized protein n=1 Tax=Dorcoceras hygrometricum TaxID=472368 RepID=A0A2Z7AFB2_9LAMI|nr:hypothetical protein F511_16977 [Dorcoceras hygrometricum]